MNPQPSTPNPQPTEKRQRLRILWREYPTAPWQSKGPFLLSVPPNAHELCINAWLNLLFGQTRPHTIITIIHDL